MVYNKLDDDDRNIIGVIHGSPGIPVSGVQEKLPGMGMRTILNRINNLAQKNIIRRSKSGRTVRCFVNEAVVQ